MEVKVILDTNFIIEISKGTVAPSMIDEVLNAKYLLITTDSIVEELNEMSKHNDELSRMARASLEIIRRLKIEVVPTDIADGDESIVSLAKRLKSEDEPVVVATLDKELQKKLRKAAVPYISLRNRGKRLGLSWDLLF
jgi:rRNA-processing protein FCF1